MVFSLFFIFFLWSCIKENISYNITESSNPRLEKVNLVFLFVQKCVFALLLKINMVLAFRFFMSEKRS